MSQDLIWEIRVEEQEQQADGGGRRLSVFLFDACSRAA